MTNIKLIIIGHSDRIVDFNIILKHKSKFFKYIGIDSINNLPKSSKNDGYLDIVYSKDDIEKLLSDINFDGLCIAIMNYRFDDNFYLHRIGASKVCISIDGIENILSKKNISIENFIVKNTYEIFLFKILFNDLTDDKVYKFIHDDTRGCLFDLNGDKRDIIYNTEQPIICDECKGKISNYPIPENFIGDIQKELVKINKPLLEKIKIFINKNPKRSISLAVIIPVILNLISNWIYDLIKGYV